MNLLLIATMIRYAVTGPMERLLLTPAANGAIPAIGASENLPPLVIQVGQAKHPTKMGAPCPG